MVDGFLTWPWVVAAYASLSTLTFTLYVVDKAAAVSDRSRIAERTLLVWGLLGGWPGAWLAQQLLRHKTRKASFQWAFWGTVMGHMAIVMLLLPEVRHAFLRGLVRILG